MQEDIKNYLKPEVVTRLNSLDLQAKLMVEGYLAGLHRSPYHGFSVEFSEYRSYMMGEPLKHVDWKKYARSDRLVVREYEDNTNLRSYLLLDTSASMAFSSKNGISKLQYSVLLAAAFAYLLIRQRDAIGAALLTQDSKQFITPRTVKGQLFRILSLLHGAEAKGDAPITEAIHWVAKRIGRRGLVILFTDLLEEAEPLLRGIKHLRHLDHEVILFHLLDPTELHFPFGDTSTFVDMETGERLAINPLKIRKAYCDQFQKHLSFLEKECREIKVNFHQVLTNQSFEQALTAFFADAFQTSIDPEYVLAHRIWHSSRFDHQIPIH